MSSSAMASSSAAEDSQPSIVQLSLTEIMKGLTDRSVNLNERAEIYSPLKLMIEVCEKLETVDSINPHKNEVIHDLMIKGLWSYYFHGEITHEPLPEVEDFLTILYKVTKISNSTVIDEPHVTHSTKKGIKGKRSNKPGSKVASSSTPSREKGKKFSRVPRTNGTQRDFLEDLYLQVQQNNLKSGAINEILIKFFKGDERLTIEETVKALREELRTLSLDIAPGAEIRRDITHPLFQFSLAFRTTWAMVFYKQLGGGKFTEDKREEAKNIFKSLPL